MKCCCKKSKYAIVKDGKKVLFEIILGSITRDINNNNIFSDVIIGSVWGSIANKNPYLKTNFNTIYNEQITHIITCRYIKELNIKHWLRYDNKVYEIINIINVEEANDVLQLFCKLRENDGS